MKNHFDMRCVYFYPNFAKLKRDIDHVEILGWCEYFRAYVEQVQESIKNPPRCKLFEKCPHKRTY